MKKLQLPTTVLLCALALGVLGDQLLDAMPWGIGALLWVVTFAATYALLLQRSGLPRPGGWWIPLLALAPLAWVPAWRDSPVLTVLAVLTMMLCSSLLMVRDRPQSLSAGTLLEYSHAALVSVAHSLAGFLFLLLGEFRTAKETNTAWKSKTAAVTRGFVLVLPPLLVFGALLVSADAEYERFVKSLFDFDLADALRHLFAVALVAWCVGGFLRGRVVASPVRLPEYPRPASVTAGFIEVLMVMGVIDLLFLSFTLFQFKYLFGGEGAIVSSPGLTVAQFARRGFFELTFVAALCLPLLLAGDWLISRDRRVVLSFRLLAGFQLLLLFVMMASAVERMLLYQRHFGLTELRVYTTAFMAWLGIVFVWFWWTVLRGKRERFAFGALVSGLAVIAGLSLLNPDDLIARVNISRAQEGGTLDTAYLVTLSDDAVPALVASLPRLKPDEQRIITEHLLRREARRSGDWRSWNSSRQRAHELIAPLAALPGSQ